MIRHLAIALILSLLPVAGLQAAIVTVGPTGTHRTISAAVAAARAGDIVEVQAGTYLNDFPVVNKPLTLRGIGGLARITSDAWIPNEKAMIIAQANLTVERFEFVGATVSSGNGAGIRYEAGNLIVRRSFFRDNQDGILAASNPTGTIWVEASEFLHNGLDGGGRNHGIYVNDIASLTVYRSYFHETWTGHHIKSRARRTVVRASRMVDGTQEWPSSHSIDVPNGGDVTIDNNQMEQAANAHNAVFVAYSNESAPYPNSVLRVRSNLFQNHRPEFALGVLNSTDLVVGVHNNRFYSSTVPIEQVRGRNSSSGNVILAAPEAISTTQPWR